MTPNAFLENRICKKEFLLILLVYVSEKGNKEPLDGIPSPVLLRLWEAARTSEIESAGATNPWAGTVVVAVCSGAAQYSSMNEKACTTIITIIVTLVVDDDDDDMLIS